MAVSQIAELYRVLVETIERILWKACTLIPAVDPRERSIL
jgi:hypothetical protein